MSPCRSPRRVAISPLSLSLSRPLAVVAPSLLALSPLSLFDPHLHEAVASIESDDLESGTVVDELQRATDGAMRC